MARSGSAMLVLAPLLLALGCGLRADHMRPAVGPPAVGLGVHVVRAVDVASDLPAPDLRVVTPAMLADLLRRALADAGTYGTSGRYVLHTRIVELDGGLSGIGLNRYARIVLENRLVDDRDPAWEWRKRETATPGLLPIPGQTYAGADARRDVFEVAVRNVARDTVRSIRDALEERAATTGTSAVR
jgi:hypothetical protein